MRIASTNPSRLRFCFREANDFSALFPLTAFLEQLDALEALQNIALGRYRAGSSQTAML
jgi:hypothetical protein